MKTVMQLLDQPWAFTSKEMEVSLSLPISSSHSRYSPIGWSYGSQLLLMRENRCRNASPKVTFGVVASKENESLLWDVTSLCKQGRLEEALQCLDEKDIRLNTATYAALLKACGKVKGIREGKQVHDHIVRNGFYAPLGNYLVDMYNKCGSMVDAQAVFDTISNPGVVAWTSLIAAYAKQGESSKVLQLIQQMRTSNNAPNVVTFVSALTSCVNPNALPHGKLIHSDILDSGLNLDVVTETALVTMYGKCGTLDIAYTMFRKMQERNIISWATIISAYARNGHNEEVLTIFHEMQVEKVVLNKIIILRVLDACIGLTAFAEGKLLHAWILKSEFGLDHAARCSLMNMYIKCKSLGDAKKLFYLSGHHDVFSWTTIMGGHSQEGDVKETFILFHQMLITGIYPNEITFITILGVCITSSALAGGKLIHAHIIKSGFESSVVVGTALINMYSKCNSLECGLEAFAKITAHNVISCTAMIGAYNYCGHPRGSLNAFKEIQQKDICFNKVTFVCVLDACTRLGSVVEGTLIHSHLLINELESNTVVGNALINMYGKCQHTEEAQKVFHYMHERNVVSWTSIITIHGQIGQSRFGLKLYQQMLKENVIPNQITVASALELCASLEAIGEGKLLHAHAVNSHLNLDTFVGSSLINMYLKCNSFIDAQAAFREIELDVITWTIMIGEYVEHGYFEEALQVFWQMERAGFMPDQVTFVGMLELCGNLGALNEGKMIHNILVKNAISIDKVMGTALVNMYGKCGSLEESRSVFDNLDQYDVVSWNSMIAIFAQHGQSEEGFRVIKHMQLSGIKPTESTFTSILSACSHTGSTNLGYHNFVSMSNVHGVIPEPEHYGCIVDLLGRVGLLNEADDLISMVPFDADLATWITLLDAYSVHVDLEARENIQEQVRI